MTGVVTRRDHTEGIRRSMTDPVRVCRALGLLRDSKRQAGGVIVRCVWHDDSDPSCSVTRGPDGTLRAKCFSCGAAGDVLALVAARYGLECRRDFRNVLIAAAELGGLHQLADELRGKAERVERPLPPMPEPEPPRDYPDQAEVRALWDSARPVAEVEACAVALALRGLFPGPEHARAITGTEWNPGSVSVREATSGTSGDRNEILDPVTRRQRALPNWARYQGRSWLETGHCVLLPTFDARGDLRSLRAWQVNRDAPGPKRLPPAGHRATGLVLANDRALSILRAPTAPASLLVCEGEPDYLSLCQAYPTAAVLGVLSGSWSSELAERIPFGSDVLVQTHDDDAGNRYAEQIKSTLAKRAIIRRAA